MAGIIGATTGLFMPGVAAAQTPPPAMAPVPTTKILAIGMLTTTPDPARMKQIMPSEVRDTVELYLDGKIDQWWVRKDQKGVVFLMNVATEEEAHALLEKLPLGEQKLMRFDLMPLGPLSPLRFLVGPQ
jgi:muconolactone delta-isomerase